MNSSHSIKNITINAIAAAALALGIVAAVNTASPAHGETRSELGAFKDANGAQAKGGNIEFEWKVEEGES